ncbi:hypothetical protein D4R52_00135 [bacterium]|nr:MAG: hypothetical protein D4R52_00135 [bacterium]
MTVHKFPTLKPDDPAAGFPNIEVMALNLLGEKNVITVQQHCELFKQKIPHCSLVVNPTIEHLQQAALENSQCGEVNYEPEIDWHLVYVSSLSIVEQYRIIGTDPEKRPCFKKDNDLEKSTDSWPFRKPEAGYYLIDASCRFRSTNWQAQEDAISALGRDYVRADETVFLQAAMSIWKKKGKRIFHSHWGRSLNSEGHRVCIGEFYSEGPWVSADEPVFSRADSHWVYVAHTSNDRCFIP